MIQVTYLVSDVARTLRRVFNARVRQLGMTGTQARLLMMLQHGEGQNQGYYAEALEVEPITLCRLVDRMEGAALVERRHDPADRRARLIYLTDQGKQRIDGVRNELRAMEQQLSAALDPSERDILVAVLDKVRCAYGPESAAGVASDG